METAENPFNISLQLKCGKELNFLVSSFQKDMKPVYDIFFQDQKTANIFLDEEQRWIQKSGTLLQFEVQDIGSAIENYYRKVFAQEQMPEIPN